MLAGVSTPAPIGPNDALVHTCRQIRKLLGSAKPSPALRIAAPHVADALPLVSALILGIEDLADRQTLIESQFRRLAAQFRSNNHPHPQG